MQRPNSERIQKILTGIENHKVLVMGDLMIDEYLWGSVRRLSPEAPVPVVEIDSETVHFGGAANVALNLKALSCQPLMLGLVGQDRRGDLFYDLLRDEGMCADFIIRTSDRPTTVKTRIIGENQHLARVDREKIQYLDTDLEKLVLDKFETALSADINAIILEDYNKGLLTKKIIDHVIKRARERDLIITVDPKFINFLEFKGVTVFKPNIKEAARALARSIQTDEDVVRAGHDLVQIMDAKSVLLTRGSRGVSLFQPSGRASHIGAKTRKVADVSGAGDTVISTMSAALCAAATAEEAAYLANEAAGIVCEQVGIVPIELRQLSERLLQQD